jgi:hypothetical protein
MQHMGTGTEQKDSVATPRRDVEQTVHEINSRDPLGEPPTERAGRPKNRLAIGRDEFAASDSGRQWLITLKLHELRCVEGHVLARFGGDDSAINRLYGLLETDCIDPRAKQLMPSLRKQQTTAGGARRTRRIDQGTCHPLDAMSGFGPEPRPFV